MMDRDRERDDVSMIMRKARYPKFGVRFSSVNPRFPKHQHILARSKLTMNTGQHFLSIASHRFCVLRVQAFVTPDEASEQSWKEIGLLVISATGI
jgi:hypothetical protein